LIYGTKSSDFRERRIENIQNVRIVDDRLFTRAKLNLAKKTVDQYVRWVRAFLRGKKVVSIFSRPVLLFLSFQESFSMKFFI